MALQLSTEQIDRFRHDGFLALDALTTPEEIERLREVYDRLFAREEGFASGDRIELAGDPDEAPRLPQIVNPERYAPELLETLARRNAEDVARQLLGPDAAAGVMHAILKPARHGAETPWHQDEAYWNPAQRHEAISVWMPLQPATLENGCMQFVPGSQSLDVRPHRLINPDAHGLVVDEPVREDEAVSCPIPAGGCTVHTSRTLHYAGPNSTAEPRRALIMAFACPSVDLPEPRDFYWQRPEWAETG